MTQRINNHVATQLKLLRERQGLTQAQIAQKLGTTQSCIGKYERGDTRLTIDFIEAYVVATESPDPLIVMFKGN